MVYTFLCPLSCFTISFLPACTTRPMVSISGVLLVQSGPLCVGLRCIVWRLVLCCVEICVVMCGDLCCVEMCVVLRFALCGDLCCIVCRFALDFIINLTSHLIQYLCLLNPYFFIFKGCSCVVLSQYYSQPTVVLVVVMVLPVTIYRIKTNSYNMLHVQCIRKEFRPLVFFHILLRYVIFILKLIKTCFPLINLHTIPNNDKAKTAFKTF